MIVLVGNLISFLRKHPLIPVLLLPFNVIHPLLNPASCLSFHLFIHIYRRSFPFHAYLWLILTFFIPSTEDLSPFHPYLWLIFKFFIPSTEDLYPFHPYLWLIFTFFIPSTEELSPFDLYQWLILPLLILVNCCAFLFYPCIRVKHIFLFSIPISGICPL